jgi:Fe-S cluster biogenesis protein NfuA
LLILYELHPDGLDARVTRAMDKFRGSHAAAGVKLEVLSTDEGIVRVRYSSESKGCGTGALKATIEAAILEAAPDANGIFVEDGSPPSTQAFVPLSALGAATIAPAPVELERSSNRA